MCLVLMLTLSIQGIADAFIPDAISVPLPPRSSKSAIVPKIATKGDIVISEIMYATSPDNLPQWIELYNISTEEVSLKGWKVTIENHPKDTVVLATKLTISLGEKVINADQVLLLVTEQGINYGIDVAKGDHHKDRVIVLKDRIGGAPGYRLLSQTAFKITLTAPVPTKTKSKTFGDIAGNLGAVPKWELPPNDHKRISIFRKYNSVTGTPYNGATAGGWELASEKDTMPINYYGHHSDRGTPGYREAEPLPVELSSFRPMRKKTTGTVVITWITESEVSNAGFNIKRSTTKDGKFEVINPAVILGAGTTNEKRVYTYTDTTAKPKIIYYYQLECISVNGVHQTLRTTHLRGSVGGANKRLQYYLKR